MPLTKLQFRPGIVRELTDYTNEGGWYDCDKVRFRMGVPEKIGGWERLSANQFLGSARAIKAFVSLDGTEFNAFGTNLKYYIEQGGVFQDITPLRRTTAAGDVTFSATDGLSQILVNDVGHGAVINDFVTFSGAASLGGNITAERLNTEHQITSIVSSDAYTVQIVEANASDTGNGGASVVGEYQINVGLDNAVGGSGWSAGTWGRGAWGSATGILQISDRLRLWSHDNFGEDLLLVVRDGGIFYWDKSSSYILPNYARAVALSDLPAADATTPTIAKDIIVSDRDRHVIVFGCDPENNIGVQDPLLIRFSDQENPSVWQSLPTNTAGDLRIGSGSEIVTAVETRQQILVFTDVSLHAMQFLGPPFTFGITQISENITIMGPNAVKAADDLVFWMGLEDFYVYSGQIQKLDCTVRSYVFDDFNDVQAEKVFAGLNSSFNEIWWFYCSANSDEINRYVTFNYKQNIWFYGSLSRTAWIDRGINSFPLSAATDGRAYFHEVGTDDGENNAPIESYIESSSMDIGDGDNYGFIRRVLPDITFSGSTVNAPMAEFTLMTKNFPGGAINDTSVNQGVTRTAVLPVEEYTNQLHVRLRGRSFMLKISSDGLGVKWRLGSPRIDLRPDGRR
jgi:hypothetical protein